MKKSIIRVKDYLLEMPRRDDKNIIRFKDYLLKIIIMAKKKINYQGYLKIKFSWNNQTCFGEILLGHALNFLQL